MQKVDAGSAHIVDQQYALARKLIEENKEKIEAMTKALLEWETIDSDQIKDIMEGRSPRHQNHLRRLCSSRKRRFVSS